ncbi:MAG: MarR family transcriptional regulator [Bacilli bacterium]|jgi:DNA-binding MarR family transcriptional regulator
MVKNLGYLIKLINDTIKKNADKNLKENELTLSQSRVLSFLHLHGNETTQKALEVDLKVSHPTVVGLVQRMEKRGFLTSTVDPKDRRNRLLTLSDKAIRIGNDMDSIIKAQEDKMMKGLDENQRLALLSSLNTVLNNID